MAFIDFKSRLLNFSFGNYNRNTDRYTMPLQVQSPNLQAYQDVINKFVNHQPNINNGSEAEVYKTTSDIGLVVGRKSNMASNGRYKIWDYSTDEEIDIKKNREAREVIKLLERPNAFQSGAEFIKACEIYYALYGNVFIYENYALETSEMPASQFLIPPDLVTIVPTGKMIDQVDIEGIISHYEIDLGNGKRRKIYPKDIIHIKNFNPANIFVGLSPLEQMGLDISNTRVAKGYLNAVSSKKGALGAISPEASKTEYGEVIPLTEEDRIELEKQFSEKTHGIFDHQSKVKISSHPIKWVEFTSSIASNQILEQIDENKRTIIDMYGLNENIFSKKGGSKFDNLLEGEKQAYTSTIIPEAEIFTDAITRKWKFFERNGMYLTRDYSHVEALKSDMKQQSEITFRNATSMKMLVVDLGYSKDEAMQIIKKGF